MHIPSQGSVTKIHNFAAVFLKVIVPLLLFSLTTARCSSRPENKELPNVIFILADDMGWGDVKAYNPESLIPTPHIDQLTEEGMSFMDAHSGGALCTNSAKNFICHTMKA